MRATIFSIWRTVAAGGLSWESTGASDADAEGAAAFWSVGQN